MDKNELDWLKPKINEIELNKNSVIINVIFSIEEIRKSFYDWTELDEFSPEDFINFISLKCFSVELLFYNFLVNGIDEDPDDFIDLIEKSVEQTYPKISINNVDIHFIFILSKEKSVCIRDFIKENYMSYKVAKLNKDTFQDFHADLLDKIEDAFDNNVFDDYHDSIIDEYLKKKKKKLKEDKSEFIDW